MHIVEWPSAILQKSVHLDWSGRAVYEPLVVPADADGSYRILACDGYVAVGMMDAAGQKVWTYGGGVDMEAADLDGDGELEYYVATEYSGLRRFDSERNTVWSTKGSYSSLASLPSGTEHGPALLARSYKAGPAIEFFNADGDLLRSVPL
jgi:hypothetical protein